MAKIKFREVRLSKSNKQRLESINDIIVEYQEQGYKLTLRQLYYQLVSRDVIPNKQSEYAKLSTLLKEGRMGGIVDWNAIEDRLRQPSSPSSWENPEDAMEALISQYKLPRMKGQNNYIEVWVEKDALSGVLKRVTEKYHIPILVNRGYSSVSAMFDAYNRFKNGIKEILEDDEVDECNIIIFYLGDFDPSGMDMIRDVEDRIIEFANRDFSYFPLKVIPIALTKEQIRKYNPPPNPAKRTDPRANKFIEEHGATSWEVDALPPNILNKLLEDYIKQYIDISKYNNIVDMEHSDKSKLKNLIKEL
jgi:hypothetical protein